MGRAGDDVPGRVAGPPLLLGPLPLATFVALALTLVFAIPPGEAPDEPAHLAYVNFVAERGELPNQLDPQRSVGQGHQAPLYYVVAAAVVRAVQGAAPVQLATVGNPAHRWRGGSRVDVPFLRPDVDPFPTSRDRGLFYALRLLSVAFAIGTVCCVRRMLIRMLDAPVARTLGLLFVATLPQFAFVSSAITADDLTILLCALTGEAFVARLLAPSRPRQWALVGVWLGLALLAKKTALFMVPTIVLCAAWQTWRTPARWRELWGGVAALCAAAVAISGWLFVRSVQLYGDLLGTAMEKQTMPSLVLQRRLTDPFFRTDFPHDLSASFVGVLGWMNLWLPAPVYALYAVVGLAAATGLFWRCVWARDVDAEVFVPLAFVGACLGGVVFYNMTFPQAQGRYLFAAIGFIAVLVGAGLGTLVGEGDGARRRLVPAAALVLLAVDGVLLWTVRAFYATPG